MKLNSRDRKITLRCCSSFDGCN